jgi:glutamyl-tRNA reductase
MHNAYAAMHHSNPAHREQVARAVQRLFLAPHRGCGSNGDGGDGRGKDANNS